MKTKILTIILFFIALSVKAQQQKYYEFGWNKLYGIVDSEGQEIIEPIYEWKNYTLHYQSPYIALNSYKKGAIIINSFSGKKEYLKYLAGSYLVDINNKEYLYGYNESEAFLMNNLELEERKILPKIYNDVRQSGDYLIGDIETDAANGKEKTVDFVSTFDYKIKLANQKIKEVNSYFRATDRKKIYSIIKKNLTIFYDENLEQIIKVNKELKEFNEVKSYLLSAVKIAISEKPYQNIETMEGAPPKYPYIDDRKETQEEGYAVFNICKSENDCKPFFKFKWSKSPQYLLTSDSYNNKIEMWSKKENKLNLLFLFYTDAKREKILFPQKYWKEIGLKLINNDTINNHSHKIDVVPSKNIVPSKNESPYQFEVFSVDREDGFYEVLNSNKEYVYTDVVLAKMPIISKSDIEDATTDLNPYFNSPVINIKLNEEGKLKFAKATEKNTGKPIAIVIGNRVISMPIVQCEISGGKLQISGNFTMEETKEMADLLKNK